MKTHYVHPGCQKVRLQVFNTWGTDYCVYLGLSGNEKGDDQLTKRQHVQATTTTTTATSTANTTKAISMKVKMSKN